MATVLSAMVAAAAAAPTDVVAPAAATVLPAAPLAYGLNHGLAHGLAYGHHAVAAPALAVAAPAPALAVAAPAISVPAPYTTSAVHGEPVVTINQAPQQISKQVHYGQQTYVAGYNSQILKPAIPDISIAVPTALKGTQQVNPAIVKVQKEAYIVNEPVHVEKPYAVPYDVPVPVRGQDIVKVTRTAPIVKHTHAGHYAAAPALAAGYAAAPALLHHGAALPAAAIHH